MSIVIKNISKVYGTQKALDNVSLSIGEGEIVGLLGPNGAGKSTMMKILTCFIPPTEGSAEICGYDIFEHQMEIKRSVGYLSEQNPLYYDMYVREFLLLVAGIHKIERKLRKTRVEEVIALTGLEKEANKKIGTLSKGYKQRVGLAQALIHDPKVLILDEPTTGLDPNQISPPAISACDREVRESTATLPANDSCTPRINLNTCDPANQNAPGS